MTPNLLVATQTLFSPHKWFVRRTSEKQRRKTEHWEHPVAGTYEYIPGRGWYLVATDCPNERVAQPIHVNYSKVLKRYMLKPDFDSRKRHGNIKDEKSGKLKNVCFFRLDDAVAWVQCWDDVGVFIQGPYKMWCIDKETGQFRHMLKGDDPDYTSRSNSRANGDNDSPRRSQESRSTQYRGEAGSVRSPTASTPSTRANSVRDISAPPTRPSSSKGVSLSPAPTSPSQTTTQPTVASVEKGLKNNPPTPDGQEKSSE
jgi:hypothetical protein